MLKPSVVIAILVCASVQLYAEGGNPLGLSLGACNPSLYDVTYGDKGYVAVGDYGVVKQSVDGTLWKAVPHPCYQHPEAGLLYGEGIHSGRISGDHNCIQGRADVGAEEFPEPSLTSKGFA